MEPVTEPTRQAVTPRKPRFGLSGKLLFLTVLFVMVAEVLIYVPSIVNFRLNWLNDRLRPHTPPRWCSTPRRAARFRRA